MQQDATVKVKNIASGESGTSVQVGGDLRSDPAKAILVDTITPHIRLDTPVRFRVNGDLPAGSSNVYAENVNSNLYVKIK